MSQKKKVIFKLIIPVILLMLIGISVIRVDTGNISLLANEEEFIPKAISKYDTVKNSSTSIASQNCTFDGEDYSSTNPIIPAGFKPVSTADDSTVTTTWGTNTGNDGLVIEDEAGNQYVWVPVENYTELTFDYDQIDIEYEGYQEEYWNYWVYISAYGRAGILEGEPISDDTAKTVSIKKYGGYYISRYELAQESGNTVSKTGLTPITGKTLMQAQNICENLYSSNSNVGSELVGKNDWNQMMKWIWPNITKLAEINGDNKTILENGAIVDGGEPNNYMEGGETDFGSWIDEFEVIEGRFKLESTDTLLTGYISNNNIYDLAGNVAEYIETNDATTIAIGGSYRSYELDWYDNNPNEGPIIGLWPELDGQEDGEPYYWIPTNNTYLTTPDEVTDLSTVGFRNVLYISPASAITYVLNGGTNDNSNPSSYTPGTEVTLKDPTKTGYTFAGWYDNSNFTGNKITKIDATQTGDITLYAKWTINTSKLTINPNGGSVSITSPTGGTAETITSSKTYTQNYNTTLTYGKPTKADTSADTKYTVTYNYNGNGESNTTAEATRTVVTSYTFSGWTKSSPFYGTLSSTTGNGRYTYPANKDVTSTITANYTSSTKTDTTTSVKLPTPEREGYTFKGWYTQASGGTKVGEGGANYTPTANVTIYAQWTINKYTVIWKDYNGDELEKDVNVSYGTTPTYDSEAPTRTYYTFTGWEPEIAEVTGNAEYTATYEPINDSDGDGVADEEDNFTVIWKDYNGDELETDTEVAYGTMPSYDGEEPTREEAEEYTYIFSGWTPEIEPVTGDITYTATYVETTYEIEKTEEGLYITNINPNTTKEIFKEKFVSNYNIEIYDLEGNKIGDEDLIGTGYTLSLYNRETLKEEGIRLIVKGDVTGEGIADCTDSGKIIYHRVGKELLEGVFKKSADLNKDGEIDGRDSTILIYHRLQIDGYKWEN